MANKSGGDMEKEECVERQVQVFGDMLSKCCLEHQREGWVLDIVKEVLVFYDTSGVYPPSETERDGVCIFITKDNMYAVLEDGEDCTGHGCQCSSLLSVFDNYDDALVLGLTKDQACNLGLLKDRNWALSEVKV